MDSGSLPWSLTIQDQFDCIDLSDNEITKLENFPQLNRLRTLLLSNNRISKISDNLGEALPELSTLILSNNKLTNLSDILPLAKLKKLKRLSLLENVITKKQHYRLYVIYHLPQLTLLDFRKVKQKERLASLKLFKDSKTQPTTQDTETKEEPMIVTGYNSKEVSAIQNAIKSATTLAQMDQLTTSLASGQVPEETKK